MTTRSRSRKNAIAEDSDGAANADSGAQPTGGTTGRYPVLFREGANAEAAKLMKNSAGMTVAVSSDFGDEAAPADFGGADSMIYENLGVAVVDTPPEQMESLGIAASEDSPILDIHPEGYLFALPLTDEYMSGYSDAVANLVRKAHEGTSSFAEVSAVQAMNESQLTWGLQATRTPTSRFSGRGIRVAVLDTGLDLGHPDFVGRSITSRSFVPGVPTAQDGHGHGTHCVGTACGPRVPGRLPRYGIAYEAQIFVGKVLSDSGSGREGDIIAGINWAVGNQCPVISMSLGAPVPPGQGPIPSYEVAAQRALNQGSLIIAAAGNESRRPDGTRFEPPRPVDHPANCPSMMAVAAVDANLRVAPFSNGGINPNGGEVNIAGPGVAVLSSWPRPRLVNTISGTSMATPHVAGIAALIAQMSPNNRGRVLWQLLAQTARHLPLSSRDVGAGLVQAPQ